MVVSCTQCEMKFKVDDAKIGPRGVKVRCIRCQTMIIVKPPENAPPPPVNEEKEAPTRVLQLDAATRAALAQPSSPPVADKELPTRVLQLDAATRAALAQSSSQAADDDPPTRVLAVTGGSFGLDPAPAAPGTLPSLPAFSDHDLPEPTRIAPPPLVGPPPIKKPPLPSPAFTPSFAAPPPAAPASSGDDLFANPFGTGGAGADMDRFMDAGSDGPSLELETRAPEKAPDPLADLPRFDAVDELPQFDGGMSAEGTVTKPVSVAAVAADARAERAQASEPLGHESVTVSRQVKLRGVESKPAEKKDARSILASIGQVVMAAVILCGYLGLYLLWEAGGIDVFLGRAQTVDSGNVSLQHVMIAPFITADGSAFWVVRGEAHNKGTAPITGLQVKVALDGHPPVRVPLGVEPDAGKLYAANEVHTPPGPQELAPSGRLPFTAIVPASKDTAAPPAIAVAPIMSAN